MKKKYYILSAVTVAVILIINLFNFLTDTSKKIEVVTYCVTDGFEYEMKLNNIESISFMAEYKDSNIIKEERIGSIKTSTFTIQNFNLMNFKDMFSKQKGTIRIYVNHEEDGFYIEWLTPSTSSPDTTCPSSELFDTISIADYQFNVSIESKDNHQVQLLEGTSNKDDSIISIYIYPND